MMQRFRRQQTGFTLVELLVGMALTTLLMGALFSFLFVSLKSWQFGSSQSTVQQTARISLDSMVRELRYAKAISVPTTSGTVNTITFTNGRNPPDVVTYRLSTSSGANPRTLYRSVNGVDNPLSENTVTALTFTVTQPRIIAISITVTDSSGQVNN